MFYPVIVSCNRATKPEKSKMTELDPQLKVQDLHTYLLTLPKSILERIYSNAACCLMVFREVPEIGRHFILRMTYISQPLPIGLILSWVKQQKLEEARSAIKRMLNLRIMCKVDIQGSQEDGVRINEQFNDNLKQIFAGMNLQLSKTDQLGIDKHEKGLEELETYADERWKTILSFMVTPEKMQKEVNSDLVEILVHSGLMHRARESHLPTITPGGFQFLLMNEARQVWFFMLQYLRSCEQRNMELVELLTFIFQLSMSTIGSDYSTEDMSDTQHRFLQHLREFGLVYQRKRKSRRFYPTRMAIDLISGSNDEDPQSRSKGYLLVETNFRVTAYTNSLLTTNILSLFLQILYRFPTMVVGIISRQSIHEALVNSITSEQIICFLRANAHPSMLRKSPVIPATVEHQIVLWEKERDRLSCNEGVLYNHFDTPQDFEILKNYAEMIGVLIWASSTSKTMVVTKDGHDDVRRYWKRNKPH